MSDPLMRLAEEIMIYNKRWFKQLNHAWADDFVIEHTKDIHSILSEYLQSEPVGFRVISRNNKVVRTEHKMKFKELSTYETERAGMGLLSTSTVEDLYTRPQIKPDVENLVAGLECPYKVGASGYTGWRECQEKILSKLNGE